MFFRAQYKANITPLINDMTRIANAIPDIQVVAHVPTVGSVLKERKKEKRTLPLENAELEAQFQ